MNAFDFDGTLYDGDSTVDFYLFCIKRHPSLAQTLLALSFDAARFKMGKLARTEFKQRYFERFLPRVDATAEVAAFWDAHRSKLNSWCVAEMKPGDVIASASPRFLLEPLCKSWDVKLLATEVDPATGTFLGPNMRGSEKVSAFRRSFPDAVIDSFYTDDAAADAPMIEIAQRSYLVHGNSASLIERSPS